MIGSNKRLSMTLLVIISLGVLPTISSCSMPQSDPNKQTIPTDSDQWQKKLGDTFEQLPAVDRQLLSRYMLRMKLSGAYESGAMPRTTIGQALAQQRQYELLHPDNPTGERSPIVTGKQRGNINTITYPIALLPVKTSSVDSLNQVKLQFILSNHGTVSIESFEGTLTMRDAKLAEGKRFDIPLTPFSPPIVPEQSGKIVLESNIEDVNVMRAIKNNQYVTTTISEGTITLIDGEKVEFP